ncbi:Protein SMG7 [Trichinella nativa]|uniref:Protein SMG7 n=1 Tax=Trichinella nativa TaxID=6335 RepID=A0A0V1LDQ7_9BILA|nr:Protein SMG7 [Trichinella nativa]
MFTNCSTSVANAAESEYAYLLNQMVNSNGSINWKIRSELQAVLEQKILDNPSVAVEECLELFYWNRCYKNCIDMYEKQKRKDGRSSQYFSSIDRNFQYLQLFMYNGILFLEDFMNRILNTSGLSIDWLDFHVVDAFHYASEKSFSSDVPVDVWQYLIQFCLIHIGDFHRKMLDFDLAERCYIQATKLCSKRGHAFNQLGILEMSSGHNIQALYFYTRAHCCEVSFTGAGANLEQYYKVLIKQWLNLPNATGEQLFCIFQALLYLGDQVSRVETTMLSFLATLKRAISTGHLNACHLVCMLVITFGSFWKIDKTCIADVRSPDQLEDQLSLLKKLIIEFLQSFLTILLSCEEAQFSVVADTLYILISWIQYQSPNFLLVNNFHTNQSHLSSLAKFLNSLQRNKQFHVNTVNSAADEQPLPIDVSLFSFLPLAGTFARFVSTEEADTCTNLILMKRLVEYGKFVAQMVNDEQLFTSSIVRCNNNQEMLQFKTKSCSLPDQLESTVDAEQDFEEISSMCISDTAGLINLEKDAHGINPDLASLPTPCAPKKFPSFEQSTLKNRYSRNFSNRSKQQAEIDRQAESPFDFDAFIRRLQNSGTSAPTYAKQDGGKTSKLNSGSMLQSTNSMRKLNSLEEAASVLPKTRKL